MGLRLTRFATVPTFQNSSQGIECGMAKCIRDLMPCLKRPIHAFASGSWEMTCDAGYRLANPGPHCPASHVHVPDSNPPPLPSPTLRAVSQPPAPEPPLCLAQPRQTLSSAKSKQGGARENGSRGLRRIEEVAEGLEDHVDQIEVAENDEEREEAVKKLKKEMKELKIEIRQQRRREAEEQEMEVEAEEDAEARLKYLLKKEVNKMRMEEEEKRELEDMLKRKRFMTKLQQEVEEERWSWRGKPRGGGKGGGGQEHHVGYKGGRGPAGPSFSRCVAGCPVGACVCGDDSDSCWETHSDISQKAPANSEEGDWSVEFDEEMETCFLPVVEINMVEERDLEFEPQGGQILALPAPPGELILLGGGHSEEEEDDPMIGQDFVPRNASCSGEDSPPNTALLNVSLDMARVQVQEEQLAREVGQLSAGVGSLAFDISTVGHHLHHVYAQLTLSTAVSQIEGRVKNQEDCSQGFWEDMADWKQKVAGLKMEVDQWKDWVPSEPFEAEVVLEEKLGKVWSEINSLQRGVSKFQELERQMNHVMERVMLLEQVTLANQEMASKGFAQMGEALEGHQTRLAGMLASQQVCEEKMNYTSKTQSELENKLTSLEGRVGGREKAMESMVGVVKMVQESHASLTKHVFKIAQDVEISLGDVKGQLEGLKRAQMPLEKGGAQGPMMVMAGIDSHQMLKAGIDSHKGPMAGIDSHDGKAQAGIDSHDQALKDGLQSLVNRVSALESKNVVLEHKNIGLEMQLACIMDELSSMQKGQMGQMTPPPSAVLVKPQVQVTPVLPLK